VILLEEFLVRPSLPLPAIANLHVVHHVGKPLDKTAEEVDRAELELGEACASAKDVKHLQVSLRGMHTDRHSQPACLFVQRKKVWVCGKLVPFNSPYENTAGTVLFAEVQLFDGSLKGDRLLFSLRVWCAASAQPACRGYLRESHAR
jgi:hypothetical protein